MITLFHNYPIPWLPYFTITLFQDLPYFKTTVFHNYTVSRLPYFTITLFHNYPISHLPYFTFTIYHHYPISQLPYFTTLFLNYPHFTITLFYDYPISHLLYFTITLFHNYPISQLPPFHPISQHSISVRVIRVNTITPNCHLPWLDKGIHECLGLIWWLLNKGSWVQMQGVLPDKTVCINMFTFISLLTV